MKQTLDNILLEKVNICIVETEKRILTIVSKNEILSDIEKLRIETEYGKILNISNNVGSNVGVYLKTKQENNYIPEPGDMFMWCDEKYWCIESNSFSGRVVHVGDTYIQKGFVWNFGGEKQIFIRKATAHETSMIFNIE